MIAAATATIVFLPYWASGHFMSMIEAGKRMLDSAGGALSLTVLVMQAPNPAKAAEVEEHVRREAAAAHCDIRFIRLPAVEPPTDCTAVEEFNFRYIQLHAPRVDEAVAGLASPVAAIVIDLFCTQLLDVSAEVAAPRYVYFASTAAFLALMLRLPALREEQHTDMFEEMERTGTLHVPGLPPVPPSHKPVCLSRKNYRWFEYYGRRFMDASGGIIINSSVELERGVLTAIADGRCVPSRPAPAVHAIGPVIWFGARDQEQQRRRHECVEWLDRQPSASVVFLCFGSIGFLDKAQVAEVAAGLERSGHQFLWVLRGPPAAGSPYPTDADLVATLPAGFQARTEGRGLVWPSWAPQKDILAHPAVGGFVTHCGWNSVLEGVWYGVPMVPWPLYGEQHLNAFELATEMGVAVELKMVDDRDDKVGCCSIVEAAELEQAVRGLMGETENGREAREKAADMMAACRRAVAESGSSCATLRKLVQEIAPEDGRHHDASPCSARECDVSGNSE